MSRQHANRFYASDSKASTLIPSQRIFKAAKRKPHWALALISILLLLSLSYPAYLLRRLSFSVGYSNFASNLKQEQVQYAILNSIHPSSIRNWIEHYFLSGPHLAGQNLELAEWTRDKYLEFGFPEAWIETFDIWVNYPLEHRVALLDPAENYSVVHELSLEEDVLKEDPTTGDQQRIQTFHGYSASGNATGQLVYANYGRKKDYDALVEAGVDLTDKIVLVKYGGIFRGLKVKLAEDLGASAVLIYSDPGDDHGVTTRNGYKAYPEGPARNPSSVQRGSVQDLSHAPGDPTTPGWPSLPDADRTKPQGIPSIPSVPISSEDALPLLKALSGNGPNPLGTDWKGGLDGVKYSIGPSKLEVNVYNNQDYDFRPNHDVIAVLPGEIEEEIIVGNHRDAWILGGADPNSGSASVLELAKALGNLYKQGWRPYRTIKFASWDGEEYGLLGSTEWGEAHASTLSKKTFAYLNSDVSYSGTTFVVSSNPLLQRAIYASAALVPSPSNKDRSIFDDWLSQSNNSTSDPYISPLGSGSDYTVFQDHLGIASMDFGFTEGVGDPVYHYHSNYDSLHWMTTFGDTTFDYHAAAAKFLGLVLTQLSEREIVQFSFTPYGQFIQDSLENVIGSLKGNDTHVDEVFQSASNLLVKLEKFDSSTASILEQLNRDFRWYEYWKYLILRLAAAKKDHISLQFDRNFLADVGLNNRPWFKHLVFAPGRYTGYAGQVFPSLAEAIEDSDIQDLRYWLEIVRNALDKAADFI